MINLKNILKVLLVALFVCAYSGDVLAQTPPPIDSSLEGAPENRRLPQQDNSQQQENNRDTPNSSGMSSTQNFVSKCGDGLKTGDKKALFSDLICTGVLIFNQLRDLIYVVAGFGIIAVAVGGFFGNLNWKWLGAIVISLVVIATAGELIVLLTGAEGVSSSLITNTLREPAPTVGAGAETAKYNNNFIDQTDPDVDRRIKWGANVERDAIYDADPEYD